MQFPSRTGACVDTLAAWDCWYTNENLVHLQSYVNYYSHQWQFYRVTGKGNVFTIVNSDRAYAGHCDPYMSVQGCEANGGSNKVNLSGGPDDPHQWFYLFPAAEPDTYYIQSYSHRNDGCNSWLSASSCVAGSDGSNDVLEISSRGVPVKLTVIT